MNKDSSESILVRNLINELKLYFSNKWDQSIVPTYRLDSSKQPIVFETFLQEIKINLSFNVRSFIMTAINDVFDPGRMCLFKECPRSCETCSLFNVLRQIDIFKTLTKCVYTNHKELSQKRKQKNDHENDQENDQENKNIKLKNQTVKRCEDSSEMFIPRRGYLIPVCRKHFQYITAHDIVNTYIKEYYEQLIEKILNDQNVQIPFLKAYAARYYHLWNDEESKQFIKNLKAEKK